MMLFMGLPPRRPPPRTLAHTRTTGPAPRPAFVRDVEPRNTLGPNVKWKQSSSRPSIRATSSTRCRTEASGFTSIIRVLPVREITITWKLAGVLKLQAAGTRRNQSPHRRRHRRERPPVLATHPRYPRTGNWRRQASSLSSTRS